MRGEYPWIYVDSAERTWKFYMGKKDELFYKIMDVDGKYSKEFLIDSGVLGIAVYMEEDATIHIVYITKKSELKYCTSRNKKWVGKILYHIDLDDFQVEHLKVEIVGCDLYIFYLQIAKDGSEHAELMSCRWNGKELVFARLEDIILIPDMKEHYVVQVREKDIIDVFYITDEGNAASLMHCSCNNNQWTLAKRLYGIQGDNITFDVIYAENQLHLLNQSRERETYLVEHVCMDSNAQLQHSRVYKSNNEIKESLLFIENNKVYCSWLEQNEFFYSSYEKGNWRAPTPVGKIEKSPLEQYNWMNTRQRLIKARKAYGVRKEDAYLFFPHDIIKNETDALSKLDCTSTINSLMEEEVQKLKEELDRVNGLNHNLEKNMDSFQMQLQKKHRFAEVCQENMTKLTDQKRKAEENISVFMEVQKNKQVELDKTKQQLAEEKILTLSLQSIVKEREYENSKVQKQLEYIVEENKKMRQEMEMKKKLSFIERLFKEK